MAHLQIHASVLGFSLSKKDVDQRRAMKLVWSTSALRGR